MNVAAAQSASFPGDLVATVPRHVALASPGLPHLAMPTFRPFAPVAREHRLTVVLANAVGPFADGVAGGRSAAWRPDGTLAASLDATGEGLVCVDAELG